MLIYLAENDLFWWLLAIFTVILYFWFVFNAEKLNKKQKEKQQKKEFEKLKSEHPEWAPELDPEKVKEQKDREEFERLAKEHPDWL